MSVSKFCLQVCDNPKPNCKNLHECLLKSCNGAFQKSDSEEDKFLKILLEYDTPRKKMTEEERDIQRFLEQLNLGYGDYALELLNEMYRKEMRKKRTRR